MDIKHCCGALMREEIMLWTTIMINRRYHGHTCMDVVVIMDDRVMNQNYEHIGLIKAIDSCLHRVCGPVVW